jgi:hypothetical protein
MRITYKRAEGRSFRTIELDSAQNIIPAQPGFFLTVPVFDESRSFVGFEYDPIVAWLILTESDQVKVEPITSDGWIDKVTVTPATFIKLPDGRFSDHNGYFVNEKQALACARECFSGSKSRGSPDD